MVVASACTATGTWPRRPPLPQQVSDLLDGSAAGRYVTATVSGEHVPVTTSPPAQEVPLAHVPQLLSPATGFRLAAAAGQAIGLHVPPPSLLPPSGGQGIGLSPPPRRQL